MRISEITNLKHEDIIKENGYEFAVIKASIAKNHKERSIPLSKIAVEQIRLQKMEFTNSSFIFTDDRGNYYKTTPRKAFNSAKNKAGLNEKYLSFHTLRHTFGSLKWQGLNINGEELKIKPSIKSISKVMGHSSTAITEQVYAKLERKDVLDILGEK
jgi:integrase